MISERGPAALKILEALLSNPEYLRRVVGIGTVRVSEFEAEIFVEDAFTIAKVVYKRDVAEYNQDKEAYVKEAEQSRKQPTTGGV